MARTATLQKVAKAAGVSVSTVSRILSRPDFATDETRRSVIGAAAKMGYPGLSYQLMAESQGGCALKTIVLLAPEEEVDGPRGLNSPEWIYRDIIPTLRRVSSEKGFQLILSTHTPDKPWNPVLAAGAPVCGVLWMDHGTSPMLDRLAQSVPVVVVNDDPSWPMRTCVMVNNRAVVHMALGHLRDLGHRRIAYFDVDEVKPSIHSRQRLAAYREGLEQYDLDANPAFSLLERFGVNGHPEAVARAMDRMTAPPHRPTALITPLGYAIQFLKESRKRKLVVPRDLSIVAIDHAHAAEVVDPALTSVDCCFGRCAEAAIELLVEQKSAPRAYAKTVLIEPKLILRASTDRCVGGPS